MENLLPFKSMSSCLVFVVSYFPFRDYFHAHSIRLKWKTHDKLLPAVKMIQQLKNVRSLPLSSENIRLEYRLHRRLLIHRHHPFSQKLLPKKWCGAYPKWTRKNREIQKTCRISLWPNLYRPNIWAPWNGNGVSPRTKKNQLGVVLISSWREFSICKNIYLNSLDFHLIWPLQVTSTITHTYMNAVLESAVVCIWMILPEYVSISVPA